MTTTDVDNWPADANGVTGHELMGRFERHARRFGTEIIFDHIHKADFDARPFTLYGDADTYACDALIIATGVSAKYIGIKTETKFLGKGVSACATCDGFLYKNKDVLVVGGGNTAQLKRHSTYRTSRKVSLSCIVEINSERKPS